MKIPSFSVRYKPKHFFHCANIEKKRQSAFKNGVVKDFVFLQGSPKSHIQFTETLMEEYTLFHISRYVAETNYQNERIVTSIDGDWISGCWKGKNRVSYSDEKWIDLNNNNNNCDWCLYTETPTQFRCNGCSETKKKTFLKPIGINFPNSIEWEHSHFAFADFILYDRVLENEEIDLVENYLASEYGIAEMLSK